jgi:hypothetical protein
MVTSLQKGIKSKCNNSQKLKFKEKKLLLIELETENYKN